MGMGSVLKCSVIGFAHLGSSLSLRGFARFGSGMSIFDSFQMGSSLSMRSVSRLGSNVSCFGKMDGGGLMSLIGQACLASSFSIRSFVRTGQEAKNRPNIPLRILRGLRNVSDTP